MFTIYELLILVPARIITTSPSIGREEKSKSINLFCSTSGTPELSITWFKNGVIIVERSDVRYSISESLSHSTIPPVLNSTIEIRDLSQGDGGGYECVATNSFGSNKKQFKVIVEGKRHTFIFTLL